MKKGVKFYAIIWAALFALFQIISFVSPGWIGIDKYTGSFWAGYVFINLTFVGQLICAFYAFRADSAQKTFYNISVVKVAYAGLILSFIFGGACMLLSLLPYWVAILVCAILLTAQVLSVVKAVAAVELVDKIDDKVKEKTFFIKSLTVDADTLLSRAKSESVKADCKKVYEAIRYSDPMSNNALATAESAITLKFEELAAAVAADNSEAVTALSGELIILVNDRNKKCKLLK